MFLFTVFSPKELTGRILEIRQAKDQDVVQVSLEYREETNTDVIIFHKENNTIYESSLLSFGKENSKELDICSPIAVDLVELGDKGEQYMFVESIRNSFASKPISLAKKVLA